MHKKIIVRFYNWQDWKKNITEGNIGTLGSNVKNGSYLKVAAIEAQSEENEVWLITASKNKNWKVSSWLKLRPRSSDEPISNSKYSTLVYYDLQMSKVIGNYISGKPEFIPEVDQVLKSFGKPLEQTGNAGFEIAGKLGKEIHRVMNAYPGQPFSVSSSSANLFDNHSKEMIHISLKQTVPITMSAQEENLKRAFEVEITSIEDEYKNKPGSDIDVIVKKRVGQSSFRNLLEKENGLKCHLSGITHKSLLIASHIVPWSKAKPIEKTDPNNGLLLAINWDAVFDKGLITFNDNGEPLFSDFLDSETIKILGLNRNFKLGSNILNQNRLNYLRRHRLEIFKQN